MANLVGRLWALRISICVRTAYLLLTPANLQVMIVGVVVQVVPNTYAVLIVGRLIT